MVKIDFFEGIQKFRQLAPGVEASSSFDEMQSSAYIARKKIKDIIEGVWGDLLTYYKSENKDDLNKNQAIEFLQGAFANMTMYQYIPFWVQKKRLEGIDLYKNEVQSLKDAYISNLWSYMDSLLDLFQEHPDVFQNWKETQSYKDRKDLLIESADEFNRFYEIGRSHYFFSKIIFIIREAGEDHIYPRIKSKGILDESGKEKLKKAIKKAVAFYTMGHALKRLDFTELPKSIRNNERDTARTMRSGYSEAQAVSELSETLLVKFEKYMDDVDFEMNKPKPGSSIFLSTDINKENDNSYYMP